MIEKGRPALGRTRSVQDTLSGDASSKPCSPMVGSIRGFIPQVLFHAAFHRCSTISTRSSLLLHAELWWELLLHSALHAMGSCLPDLLCSCSCPMGGVPLLTGMDFEKHVRCSVGQEPGPYCPHLACLCYPLLWGLRGQAPSPGKPWPCPADGKGLSPHTPLLWKWCLLEV